MFKPDACFVLHEHIFCLTFMSLGKVKTGLCVLSQQASLSYLCGYSSIHTWELHSRNTLQLSATEQLCRTDGLESKERCHHGALAARWMSSSSSGLMNTQPPISLFAIRKYCVIASAPISPFFSIFKKCIYNSCFPCCVHSHICHCIIYITWTTG